MFMIDLQRTMVYPTVDHGQTTPMAPENFLGIHNIRFPPKFPGASYTLEVLENPN